MKVLNDHQKCLCRRVDACGRLVDGVVMGVKEEEQEETATDKRRTHGGAVLISDQSRSDYVFGFSVFEAMRPQHH